jgi:hypothetical protein
MAVATVPNLLSPAQPNPTANSELIERFLAYLRAEKGLAPNNRWKRTATQLRDTNDRKRGGSPDCTNNPWPLRHVHQPALHPR